MPTHLKKEALKNSFPVVILTLLTFLLYFVKNLVECWKIPATLPLCRRTQNLARNTLLPPLLYKMKTTFLHVSKKASYLVCTGFPYLCIKAPRTEIAFVLVFIDFLFFVCVFIVCPMLLICFNVADVFFFNNIGFAKIVLMQGFP